MAIARVQKIGTAANDTTGLSTLALTVTNAVTAGNLVVVTFTHGSNNNPTWSVTDTAGNTYQQDLVYNSGGLHCAVFSSKLATGLVNGNTITVTWTGSTVNRPKMGAYEYSGITATGFLDGTGAGAIGTSLTPASGSYTTTQAAELLIGVVMADYNTSGATNNAVAAGTNWTALDNIQGPTSNQAFFEERIVASTASYNATGTIAGTGTPAWAAIMASYKALVVTTVVAPVATVTPSAPVPAVALTVTMSAAVATADSKTFAADVTMGPLAHVQTAAAVAPAILAGQGAETFAPTATVTASITAPNISAAGAIVAPAAITTANAQTPAVAAVLLPASASASTATTAAIPALTLTFTAPVVTASCIAPVRATTAVVTTATATATLTASPMLLIPTTIAGATGSAIAPSVGNTRSVVSPVGLATATSGGVLAYVTAFAIAVNANATANSPIVLNSTQAIQLDAIVTGWLAPTVVGHTSTATAGRLRTPATGSIA